MATPPTFTAGSVLTAAQMNAIGSFKLSSQTLTGTGTSADFNSVFTDDYASYMITVRNLTATAGEVRMQLKSGTTPAALNYYSAAALAPWVGAVAAGGQINNGAYYYAGFSNGANYPLSFVMYIHGPKVAARTGIHHQGYAWWDNMGTGGGFHNDATAYDGFKLYHATANISGTITVYGLRN